MVNISLDIQTTLDYILTFNCIRMTNKLLELCTHTSKIVLTN